MKFIICYIHNVVVISLMLKIDCKTCRHLISLNYFHTKIIFLPCISVSNITTDARAPSIDKTGRDLRTLDCDSFYWGKMCPCAMISCVVNGLASCATRRINVWSRRRFVPGACLRAGGSSCSWAFSSVCSNVLMWGSCGFSVCCIIRKKDVNKHLLNHIRFV